MFGYSKQAYYKSIVHSEQKAFDEYLIVELIRRKRRVWKKGSGRNLLASLQGDFTRHRIQIGRDKFFELLKKHGLQVRRPSRSARTTQSRHPCYKYPNLIEDLVPQQANQVWVSDITFLWCQAEQCFVYLYLVTDMYSRKIVGFAVGRSLHAHWAVQALQRAIDGAGVALQGLIHHSDRGVQYCSGDYISLLRVYDIQPSMTSGGDPLENPIAERVNRTIKEEFMENYKKGYQNVEQALTQIPVNIRFYNEERPHSSIGMMTPRQAHSMVGYIPRKWKNYYKTKVLK